MDDRIQKLYDAVGHDTALGDALDALRCALDARTYVLVSTRMDGSDPCKHILTRGVPEKSLLEYEYHFHRYDVWLQAALRMGLRTGMVTCGDELVTPDELRASYFWRAFLTRYDTVDALSAMIELPPDADALTFITFHRGSGQARFGPDEKHQIQQWQPHLATALRQHRRLAPSLAFGRTLGQVFEACVQPMVVLSGQGIATLRNSAFERWRKNAGPLLRVDDSGHMQCAVSGDWRLASQLLSSVLSGREARARVLLSSDDGREVAQLVCHAVEPTFMEPTGTRERSTIALVEYWEPDRWGSGLAAWPDQPGAIAAARAQERQRIMRDLHDGLGVHLVGLRSLLGQMDAAPQLLVDQVDAAMDEMRMTVDALSPEGQDLCTLLGMLRFRISPRLEAAGLVLAWDVPPSLMDLQLSAEQVRHVQRIVLEALTNVLKHAQARVARIEVRQDQDGVEVAIVDDGLGLSPERATSGRGLANMRKRAEWLGAALSLASGDQGGTAIRLRFQTNAMSG